MPQAFSQTREYLQAPPLTIVHRPRAVLPATAQAPLFRIRGGRVRVLACVGKVTTAADATVTNATLVANPDSGLTDVNLNTATAVTSAALGNLIGPQGAGIGAALTIGGAILGLDNFPVLDIGTLDLLTSATNAGALEWFLLYQAVEPQASVRPVLPGTVPGYKARDAGQPQLLHRGAANLPQTAQSAIFTAKTGPVLLMGLWGRVTTVFGATATNLTLVGNASSGVADVNLNTATAVANLAAGSLFGIQVAGIGSALATGGALTGLRAPVVVDAGTIDWLTSGSNTGAAEFFALWLPIHPAGRLVLA